MQRLVQVLLDGVSLGSLYSLLALGVVIAFRGSRQMNLAQGEMALTGTYLAWQFHQWGLALWAGALAAMACAGVVGAVVQSRLIGPLARRSPRSVLVVLVALMLGFNEVDGAVWGGQPKAMASLFPNRPGDFIRMAGAGIRWTTLGSIGVMAVVAGALWVLFNRTRVGLALRAVAADAESARLVGIDTARVLAASWALAGAVGALGGVLVAGVATNVSQGTMADIFIAATAAATLGGLDSPLGAVIGGLTIGIVENVVAEYQSTWIGQDLKVAPALVLLVAVLVLRPGGLFASGSVERV
jgi:branched-chain amino acid transport system permease protein